MGATVRTAFFGSALVLLARRDIADGGIYIASYLLQLKGSCIWKTKGGCGIEGLAQCYTHLLLEEVFDLDVHPELQYRIEIRETLATVLGLR